MTTKAKAKPRGEKKPAKKMGRPSKFSQATVNAICERIAKGESLRKVLEDDGMPSMSMVMRWLADEGHADFREQYARATESRADKYFDEILEIADTPKAGVKTKTNAKGVVEMTEGDMIDHRRLQVDARKFVVARLAPKKYGDKLELSGDAEHPVSLRALPAPEMDLGKILPRGMSKA